MCVWWRLLQLSVCTTPGISVVYCCALMHGPSGNMCVCVGVWCDCVRVCVCVSNSTVRVSDARLAFDRRCCTKHSMYLFQSWISGIIWFQSMISLVVHICFFMQCSSALQGSSRVSQLREKGGLLPLIFPPPLVF